MIAHDQVDRDVTITATITGTTGVLAVGGVTAEITSHSPDRLRETVMSRVLGIAAEIGGPVQMTISEDGTETVLLVAPDGETTAVAALLPPRVPTSAGPLRHRAGAAGGALLRPGLTVLAAAGTLVAVLILVGALLLAGGDGKEPASADVGPTVNTSTTPAAAPTSTPTSEPPRDPQRRIRPQVKVTGGENRLSVSVTTNRVAKVRWVLIGPKGRTLESEVVRVGPKGWIHTRKPTQAGDYSWRVEPVATRGVTARGAVQVTAPPPPPPVEEPEDPTYTPPPTYSPPPSNDGGDNNGGGGHNNSGGGQDPPDPVDPDDVPDPIDPDDQ